MSEMVEISKERELSRNAGETSESVPVDDRAAVGALENALAACEDDQDVQAARTAKAEAVADLAEFDENIPLDEQDKEKEPEMSKAEQEVENLIKQVITIFAFVSRFYNFFCSPQLTPIERYAMRFIEETEIAWSAEQLAAAEREIEEQKREWEENRLAAMREEEKRRAREMEEESDLLTFSREDATNQVSKTKKVTANRRISNTKKVRNVNKNSGGVKKIKKISESCTESESDVNVVKRKGKTRVVKRKQIIEPDSTTQSSISENESTKINGDDCTETSCESEIEVNNEETDETDSDSVPLAKKIGNITQTRPVNHIDHNSPRTRSHGTVAINLWTLDVSPILPGVRPVVKTSIKRERSRNSSSEKEVDIVENKKNNSTLTAKRKKKFKGKKIAEIVETTSNDSVSSSENLEDDKEREKMVSMCKEKVCKVVVQDVMTTEGVSKYLPKNNNKNVDITKNLDKEVEVEIANADESFNNKTSSTPKKRRNIKNCNSTLDNWLEVGKDDVLSDNSILRTSNKEPNED